MKQSTDFSFLKTFLVAIGCTMMIAGSSCKKETVCNNDCIWAQDGQCDDGGEGSVTSLCGEGSDCDDCGPRFR